MCKKRTFALVYKKCILFHLKDSVRKIQNIVYIVQLSVMLKLHECTQDDAALCVCIVRENMKNSLIIPNLSIADAHLSSLLLMLGFSSSAFAHFCKYLQQKYLKT